jgi:hypothetical protein
VAVDVILIPEHPFDIELVCGRIRRVHPDAEVGARASLVPPERFSIPEILCT